MMTMKPLDIYKYGIENFNTPYKAELIDVLLKNCDAKWLFLAGRDWEDQLYDKRILDALLAMDGHDVIFYISKISCEWPVNRYDSRVVEVMIENNCWKTLLKNILRVPYVDFYDEKIVEKIVKKIVHNYCYDDGISNSYAIKIMRRMGKELFKRKYAILVANKMFSRRYKGENAKRLYEIGVDWSDDVFIPEIGYYLYLTRDEYYISSALNDWSEYKKSYIKKSKVVVTY